MSLKARIDRLYKESGAAEEALRRAHLTRRAAQYRAVLLHFLRAIPPECGTEAEAVFTDALIERFVHAGWVAEDAPLLARAASSFNFHGWYPSPLPGEWVACAVAHPAAGLDWCTACGFAHPSGGHEWKDGQKVYAAPRFTSCLHCGAEVSDRPLAYFFTHNSRHPWGDDCLGEILLAGRDPAAFDPKRNQK